ncbi:remorin 1.4-like [Typha latifolia]|uniref:remorin 1.4-like n=1 Tax=Typha latifolia TaxID=4733 RepID=UPI003C2FD194
MIGEEETKVEMVPVGEEKVVKPPLLEDMLDDTKDVAVVENVAGAPSPEKSSRGSADRDAGLARVETEKKMSFVKAWEDNEKSKVENKAQKKMSSILSWEN